MTPTGEKIWFDGKLVPWNEATVHVLTHTLHYGLGVFEGIRAYELTDGSTAIFRLKEHIERLFDSARINLMEIPFSPDEIMEACRESIRANGLKHGYIRPLAFIGDGAMGLYAIDNPIRVIVAAWAWGSYLGEEGVKNGIRVKVSSFTRHHINSTLNKSKTCANYVNSILAKREALLGGYDEAILLDASGNVVEATGENIFLIRKGVVSTPESGGSVLDGITADAIRTIFADQGITVQQRRITRDELYIADEVFLCGTAAEVTPIREIDNRTIGSGKPGPLTQKVQEIFFKTVQGGEKKYSSWLDRI